MSNPARFSRRLPQRAGARVWVFALLVVICLSVAVGYTAWVVVRGDDRPEVGGPMPIDEASEGLALTEGTGGTLMVQNRLSGEHWAQIAVLSPDGANGSRRLLPLRCLRVHFAADRGLCLAEDDGLVTQYHAYVLGPDFRSLKKLSLGGIPSRARVAPDGRYGATTVFVTGHSYSDQGFSTETLLIDLTTGSKIGNLEDFVVLRDADRIEAADFNFWGVTFAADSNRFYATLATQGQTYLVEGDVAARRMRVLRDNVECPSLSPDGTRLAFKKRVGGDASGPVWQFHVLDLATMAETPLAERRSIDDQIEWLDDGRVLYGDARGDLWVLPADGSGEPSKFMSKAASPTVIRTKDPPPAAPGSADTLVLPQTDLALEVAPPPGPGSVGADLTYTVTVTNRGSVDATDVTVNFEVPAGAGIGGTVNLSSPTGNYGCSGQGQFLTCDTYLLPSGSAWTLAITLRPEVEGTLRSRIWVNRTEADPAPGNDATTTEIDVAAAK
jgi:hypothetical protein